jgi:hypothetical protein
MRIRTSSESKKIMPGTRADVRFADVPHTHALPCAAAVLAVAWFLSVPIAAFAQHSGGGGGGHSGGGHSGGGHASAAPAGHSGSAPGSPAAHVSAPAGVVSARGTGASGGERGEGGAAAARVPHVVYGGYGYFVPDGKEAPPVERFAAANIVWQDPPARGASAVPARPGVTVQGRAANPSGVSMAPRPHPVTSNGSGNFVVNNFGMGPQRFPRRGGSSCSGYAYNPCYGYGNGYAGFGYGFGLGFGYGLGYFGGSYGVNPADFNAQDGVSPNPWIGNYLYEGTEEAAQVDAATAPGPLTVFYFSDGSSYAVKDYWLDNGQLHYVTSYGGENAIALDRVDLQRTVDENAKNGIDVTLRPAQPGAEKP